MSFIKIKNVYSQKFMTNKGKRQTVKRGDFCSTYV